MRRGHLDAALRESYDFTGKVSEEDRCPTLLHTTVSAFPFFVSCLCACALLAGVGWHACCVQLPLISALALANVLLSTHVHVYAHTHVHVYAPTHVHVYAPTHGHVYAPTHVHVYAHTHVLRWFAIPGWLEQP